MTRENTIFTCLLDVLCVPHTAAYSDGRFRAMPFQSLFGLSKLLQEYGVATAGVSLDDRKDITDLPVPFVAPLRGGEWVIVSGTDATAGTVSYLSHGRREQAPIDTFTGAWGGTALLCGHDDGAVRAIEPHYAEHRLAIIMTRLRNIALVVLLTGLSLWLFVENGLWKSWVTMSLVVVSIIGFLASYFLGQKTIGIHTKFSDSICSAIQHKGCDHVLDSGGTFLGIFHWSEVGLGYFGVTLLALLTAPQQTMPWLAFFNVFCLPYSFWSIGYQKFKAHAWCTFCLIVQATLWTLAAIFFFGGVWKELTTFNSAGPILLACYIIAVLGINWLLSVLNRQG